MEKNNGSMGDHLLKLVVVVVFVVVMNTHQVHSIQINRTLVTDAALKGAVCLDGSPAAYYFMAGSGEGVNKWKLNINGGGWCADDAECAKRRRMYCGSTAYNPKDWPFNDDPDFGTWNRVVIIYCDSSSLMGLTDHPSANVTGRGARIFDVVIEELSQKGLTNATEVIFGGGSAGGLAALFHCDSFRALFPQSTRVKCLIDSGFFIHAPKLKGAEKRANWFANVAAYHGFTHNLPSSCRSRMSNPSMCMFPEYFIKDIKTPLFLIESKFDQYQMSSHYLRDDTDPIPFDRCTKSLRLCTPDMLESIKDYGVALREQMQKLRDTTKIGMFVHPCITHGGGCSSYSLGDKTLAQAIVDWFYDRDNNQEIDYLNNYPLNCTACPPTFKL